MKKILFTLAIAGVMTIGMGTVLAEPPHHNGGPGGAHNPPPSAHHGHHNPPPPRHHHHHRTPPPPRYSGYYAPPVIPMNQVITVNSPYGSYYYSTPYYTTPYPYGYYYPNKTLTVRTRHVLFSI